MLLLLVYVRTLLQEESSAAPSGSGGSSSVNPLTEDRVAQLIATQMASLSESFAIRRYRLHIFNH